MNIFQTVKTPKIKRNAFNLGHEVKLTCRMADLVPIMCQEVVPGDTFKVNTQLFMRFAPMLAPIMHRVDVYTHFFFVPNRLLWDEWEDFITGGPDGDLEPTFPRIFFDYKDNSAATGLFQYYGSRPGCLADYLGVNLQDFRGNPAQYPPVDTSNGVSLLPFRAYQFIYNEYYRDQNLEDPVEFSLGSGFLALVNPNQRNEIINLLSLRQRAWEKDYFSSALPWTQRGGDATIPFNLEGSAPVVYDDSRVPEAFGAFRRADTGAPVYMLEASQAGAFLTAEGSNNANVISPMRIGDSEVPLRVAYDPSGTLKADFSQGEFANNVTINDLRRAYSLQTWLERNAVGGARYIEQIMAHFGVKSSDARLQRPEYLGGGKTPVVISEVLQNSSTVEDVSPLGDMAGHGVAVGRSHSFTRFFEEHGYVIGIMSVLPRTGYQQGLPKHFSKFDKFDYYFPEFAHLGEQEIKTGEIFFDGTPNDQELFGYTPRYAEYKYAPGRVHGHFKDNLNFWHLGRIFTAPPVLNKDFVHPDPETLKRIFAFDDSESEHLYVQLYNDVKALRPMPRFGTPSW